MKTQCSGYKGMLPQPVGSHCVMRRQTSYGNNPHTVRFALPDNILRRGKLIHMAMRVDQHPRTSFLK